MMAFIDLDPDFFKSAAHTILLQIRTTHFAALFFQYSGDPAHTCAAIPTI
jgi:hypothetical protein